MNKILAQDEVDALLRGLSGGDIKSETGEVMDAVCQSSDTQGQ
jgi:flagellar motor switch protein FliM